MRPRWWIVLALALAIPAGVQALLLRPTPQPLCFAHGATTYQIVPDAPTPAFKVRIDDRAEHPDLTVQFVNDPGIADLVLIDETDDGDACKGMLTTVRVGVDEPAPDVTVRVASDGQAANYRMFVQSTRFSPHDATALLAVMWKIGKTQLADQRAP